MDMAVREESREWSVGVISRDRQGGFFTAGAVSFHNDISVIEVKAYAILFGL